MLAPTVTKLPVGPAWKYQLKFDGYRALGIKANRKIRLLSGNGKNSPRVSLRSRAHWRRFPPMDCDRRRDHRRLTFQPVRHDSFCIAFGLARRPPIGTRNASLPATNGKAGIRCPEWIIYREALEGRRSCEPGNTPAAGFNSLFGDAGSIASRTDRGGART
jgi:hypothetical protein